MFNPPLRIVPPPMSVETAAHALVEQYGVRVREDRNGLYFEAMFPVELCGQPFRDALKALGSNMPVRYRSLNEPQ